MKKTPTSTAAKPPPNSSGNKLLLTGRGCEERTMVGVGVMAIVALIAGVAVIVVVGIGEGGFISNIGI
jgi:hypothetical protein